MIQEQLHEILEKYNKLENNQFIIHELDILLDIINHKLKPAYRRYDEDDLKGMEYEELGTMEDKDVF